MIKLGNSLGHRSIPTYFVARTVDPLDLNPYLYFDGSDNVTTAGGAVSSWSERSAGSNQLNKTLAQGTAGYQPDNTTEKSVDFDGSDDRLAFDVAVAQAGVLICATNNGCFAFVVNSDTVDEITALGWETGQFIDLDLFAYVLLPTTVTDAQIKSVITYLVEVKGATRNPTGTLANYWWGRTDILTPKFDSIDFSGATNLGSFRNSGLTSFPSISWAGMGGWSVAYAFNGCSDLASFEAPTNTSGVTQLVSTFNGCSSLTSMPVFDTSNVTGWNLAWFGCGLTSFSADWDVSAGTNFDHTWYNNDFTSFPDLTYNDSSPILFYNAWNNCTSLTSFPASDLSKGTNFYRSWLSCTSLASFPSGITFSTNPSDALNFSEAWKSCTSLEEFPALDLSGGTNFLGAWHSCTSLTSFLATGLVSSWDFYTTWKNCTSLTTFPAIPLTGGQRFQSAWHGCTALTSFLATDLDSSGTNFISAWAGCTALTTMPAIPLTKGTNFSYAWYQCSSLTSFLATDLNLGQGFEYSWASCSSLANFPANLFDSWSPASVVVNCFNKAWSGCTSLTATSVENILNSLATAGVAAPSSGVDITISYDAGTGTPSIASAVATLKGLSPAWTITLNGVAQ